MYPKERKDTRNAFSSFVVVFGLLTNFLFVHLCCCNRERRRKENIFVMRFGQKDIHIFRMGYRWGRISATWQKFLISRVHFSFFFLFKFYLIFSSSRSQKVRLFLFLSLPAFCNKISFEVIYLLKQIGFLFDFVFFFAAVETYMALVRTQVVR